MKIMILSNDLRGLYNFRGAFINELRAMDNEVIVACPEDNAQDFLNKLKVQYIKTPISRRSINPFRDFKLFLLYCFILMRSKPQLVITYTIKCNVWGGLASRIFSIPYVSNITGLGTAFQKSVFLRQTVTFLYRRALRDARRVFFENIENFKTANNFGFVTENQAILLNGAGVDLELFRPLPLPSENTLINFLMIGRVMREKGVAELIWAAERLRNKGYKFKVTIIGELEENYRNKLDELREKSILFYEGAQNNVIPFIQACHVMVLPSHHEGMSNALLEAAACARPIITTNIHGCKEAVIDGVSGFLVEKENPEDLFIKMIKFCELKRGDIASMGEHGRKHMELHFDKRKVVHETIKSIFKY